MSRPISRDDLRKNSKDWIVINGDVYDVSRFTAHPGGVLPLKDVAGQDVTKQFAMLHDQGVLAKLGVKFKIGRLVDADPKPLPAASSSAAKRAVPPHLTGNTSHILPMERSRATFDAAKMTEALYGGPEQVAKRRFIMHPSLAINMGTAKYDKTREELIEQHVSDFISIHKPFTLEGYRPGPGEVNWMAEGATNSGSLMPHFLLFMPTLLGQCSQEQIDAWVPRALRFGMIGAYGQTELSHGSNVRGLQTVATYDKQTQQFILNSPSLGSTKWWNSNAGVVATHAAVYAQLVLDGKEMGVHTFLVQLRDENHNWLPGISGGDVGVKMGDNGIDTSWLRFDNVRIPREHMFAKRQHVAPNGTYVKHGREGGGGEYGHYLTMMMARAGAIGEAGGKLSIACTIAARYSCVRLQGFAESNPVSFQSSESAVIDYQVQRYRVLKQVAIAYALKAVGTQLGLRMDELQRRARAGGSLDDIQEVHASAAGLKGMATKMAADGIEDLRKACGGHGYLLNSGIAALFNDYVWKVTAEGDFVVMTLQTARYLLKALASARKGGPLAQLTECLTPLRDPGFVPLKHGKPPAGKSVDAVRDIDYLLRLFQFRSLVAIDRVGRQFDQAMQRAGGRFEVAFNACALALSSTAQSHCQYFTLKNFADQVRRQQTDPAVAKALSALCSLYALSEVLDGKQFVGLLDAEEFELCEQAVAAILEEQRGNVVAFVDAFDWPDSVLNSTLGRADGNVYEALFEAALNAPLNQDTPYKGYEVVRKSLDLDFLKLRNQPSPELKGKL